MGDYRTQKSTIKVFKETRGKLAVITFTKTGKRISSYGGLTILAALAEISRHKMQNPERNCLIVDDKKAPCVADNIAAYAPFIWDFTK